MRNDRAATVGFRRGPESKHPNGGHVVDNPKSTCDCRECWYMRGFNEALARIRAAGVPEIFLRYLPRVIEPPVLAPRPVSKIHEMKERRRQRERRKKAKS